MDAAMAQDGQYGSIDFGVDCERPWEHWHNDVGKMNDDLRRMTVSLCNDSWLFLKLDCHCNS